VLIGEFHNNLDSKQRLVIPVKFRNEIGEKCYITRGYENSIFLYREAQWLEFQAKLSKLSLTKKSNRLLTRFFLSSAIEAEFDSQGRISIPKSLTEHANLIKECVVSGMGERIEIWNKDNWNKYFLENIDQLDEISEELEGIDL
jgi:MraZ protein